LLDDFMIPPGAVALQHNSIFTGCLFRYTFIHDR
jgi:hypothetical protein